MKINGALKGAFATSLLALISACGGGGSSGGSGAGPTTNASPGGIWTGTESVSGLQVTGLIDESGEGHFIRTDGVQYVGTVVTTGNSVSANVDGFSPMGSAFPDGSTHGTGSVTGTIHERVSASLSTTFTTDAGNVTTGTLDLTFNSLYNVPSALSTIAGNYTDPSTGTVVTIDSNGVVFAQDATTGCVVNGMVSIIDATYNAYGVQVSYQSCTGSNAVLNGVQFNGLATLNNTVSPEQIIAGLSGQSGATKYAIVYALNHS